MRTSTARTPVSTRDTTNTTLFVFNFVLVYLFYFSISDETFILNLVYQLSTKTLLCLEIVTISILLSGVHGVRVGQLQGLLHQALAQKTQDRQRTE